MRCLALLVLVACGDPEGSRICLNPPCLVPGRASPACEQYVACAYATGTPRGSLDSTYGSNGICWENPSTMQACTDACASGLSSLRTAFRDAGC